jgi:phosphatidylserine synthase
MVMVFAAHAAETPAGKFVGVPMPVAPVVVCVILVSAVLIHKVGVEDAVPAVLFALTVIVPVALTVPQPPIKGME